MNPRRRGSPDPTRLSGPPGALTTPASPRLQQRPGRTRGRAGRTEEHNRQDGEDVRHPHRRRRDPEGADGRHQLVLSVPPPLCLGRQGVSNNRDSRFDGGYCGGGAVLHYLRDESDVLVCKFPLVSLKNVYMFPGIPAYLERDFHYLEKLFYSPDTKFHVRDIFLSEDENNLTGKLNDLVSHSPAVTVGSYPEVNNRYYRTRVSLQSESESELLEAEEYLRSSFSDEVIVDFDINSISHAGRRIYDIIALRGEPHLSGPIASAVKILEECLDRYSTDEICISFNGGKDCTVILHLLHGVLLHRYPENTPSIQAVYITCSTPFDEVEVFIDQMVKRYNVTLWRIEGPIKKGLEELTKKEPKVKAILMGTRWTDPYSKTLQPFQMTDEGWPQFMRVSPILDWNYQTVWTFLRTLSVQYCTLYDHGYTSLGGIHNTIKNPHLKYSGEDKKEHHYPAYFLKDMALERAGRT
ncbi:FAD synthase-like isoform X4 [Penaeus monodon]|uniref:FAD synthase-like isoform X4 n=1 Tax=Penaeus monodon TaxID=6687 RepID=UPI0018A6FA60|nr:FAD synthase-like isoform X4 [Penaeus monodon]